MTASTSTTAIRPASWHRRGHDWHLIGAGHIYARIDRDGRRWLCYAIDDSGDDTFLGQARSLANGKAHLSLRFAPRLPSDVIANEVAPM
ncbi:MAG: hypothetical protein K2X41_04460 [Hyphomicrobium sp.]|nr:hypothetical protein [Hyphomicrobium sp.]